MQRKRKQGTLRDWGGPEEKMFKIRPEIAIGVKQVDNGL